MLVSLVVAQRQVCRESTIAPVTLERLVRFLLSGAMFGDVCRAHASHILKRGEVCAVRHVIAENVHSRVGVDFWLSLAHGSLHRKSVVTLASTEFVTECIQHRIDARLHLRVFVCQCRQRLLATLLCWA
jgi:hypothetical protein